MNKASSPLTPQSIDAAWVKEHALQLGFTLVGITTPDAPPHGEVYRHWIRAGYHADMAYLARPDAIQKRLNPRALLPSCQSIIVTGTFYTPVRYDLEAEFEIASYALGEDYHDTLTNRLKELILLIEQRTGAPVQHRIYTDTGPLLERELGQRSGLGWIGKNTCLINPRFGSHFLLAEILTDLALDPDPPFLEDRCGNCTRCIDACPTRCILNNRTIDARRCISYLTIENNSHIPRDLRHDIGTWLFGCDICQRVCPWNTRFGDHPADPAFEPRSIWSLSSLSDFLKLQSGEWRSVLQNSPLERPRRKGLLRNAAIIAGNHASTHYIDDLEQILRQDPEPVARAAAAWALGQIRHPHAAEILSQVLSSESDPEVRGEVGGA